MRNPPGKKVPFHFHNCDEQVTVMADATVRDHSEQCSFTKSRNPALGFTKNNTTKK